MSDARIRILLRCYPPAWRASYGDELEDVIALTSRGRPTWRACLDLARGGVRERLHASGLTGDALPPRERARTGTHLVLWAWLGFVVAAVATEKISEHWQGATPAAGRSVPAAAFDVLVAGAAIATSLVLAAISGALPALAALVRNGGLRTVRRPLLRAGGSTIAAAMATLGLVVWAHHLSDRQRNGHDLAYGLGVGAWALVVIAWLVAWTAAASACSRQIALGTRVLVAQTWLAASVTTAMLVMSGATAAWWATVRLSLPQMVAPMALMSVATALAMVGTARAVRALPELRAGRSG